MKFRFIITVASVVGVTASPGSPGGVDAHALTAIAEIMGVAPPGPEWSLMPGSAMIYDAACCKVCSKGKACGDSCISREKECHKGQGCACNG